MHQRQEKAESLAAGIRLTDYRCLAEPKSLSICLSATVRVFTAHLIDFDRYIVPNGPYFAIIVFNLEF